MKKYPTLACALCLEDAGGRQKSHGIPWLNEACEICDEVTAVTRPRDFGSPALEGFESPRLEAYA